MFYTLHNLFPLEYQNTITGSKGDGKTTFGMMYWALYLAEGKRVYTNFDLYGWWPDIVARVHFGARYSRLSREKLHGYYRDVMSRCYRFDEIDDLYEERVPRSRGENPEGKMLALFDEATIRINSRTYTERSKADKERHGTSVRTTTFFSQARKLGWHLLFIAQNDKDLDAQYRNQGGYTIKCKNLKKHGAFGFRSPVQIFSTGYFNGPAKAGNKLAQKFWLYPKYLASVYDSWEVFDDVRNHGLRLHLDPDDPFGNKYRRDEVERIAAVRVGALRDARSAARLPSAAESSNVYRPGGVGLSKSAAVLVAPPETVMEHRNPSHARGGSSV